MGSRFALYSSDLVGCFVSPSFFAVRGNERELGKKTGEIFQR
jgi:hypothetical protein